MLAPEYFKSVLKSFASQNIIGTSFKYSSGLVTTLPVLTEIRPLFKISSIKKRLSEWRLCQLPWMDSFFVFLLWLYLQPDHREIYPPGQIARGHRVSSGGSHFAPFGAEFVPQPDAGSSAHHQ